MYLSLSCLKVGKRTKEVDIMIEKCKDCGKDFEITDGEREFYESKGLSLPKRCKECREKNKTGGAPVKKGSKTPLWVSALVLVALVVGMFIFGGNDQPDMVVRVEQSSDSASDIELEVNSDDYEESVLVEESTPDEDDSPHIKDSTPDNTKTPVTESIPEESEPVSEATSVTTTATTTAIESEPVESTPEQVWYEFRYEDYLVQHFDKHGEEFDGFGYETAEDYLEGANRVINDPAALTKTEKEDGDYIFYLEDSNEFVVLSKDGYIRTYFRPNAGIDYFNRQ